MNTPAAPVPPTPAPLVPRRADDLELIGSYQGSGLKEPPCLVRRGDGQVVQLSPLLFHVLSAIDGTSTLASIATTAGAAAGRDLAPDDVRRVVEEKLAPSGLASLRPRNHAPVRSSPLLALRFRARVIPPRVVRALTTMFYPLFWAPVVTVVLAAFAALDVWLFAFHGVDGGIYSAAREPVFILAVIGLTIASVFFHECGHATACRYSGGRPGGIGVGIYIVWPAFFTDVTDSYRLSKAGRIRTDLGGVYFNAIFSLATAGVYLATGIEALLLVIVLQHVQMLFQFLPFLRLDGYYLVADVTGVPDLFARIGPTLRSLVPWRHDPRARELKLWVRVVVTLWVLATVAFLVLMFGTLAIQMPLLLTALVYSAELRLEGLLVALDSADLPAGAVALIELFALVLPVVGIALTVAGITRRIARSLIGWSRRQTPRTAVVASLAALGGAILLSWWPATQLETPTVVELQTLVGHPEAVADLPARSGKSTISDRPAVSVAGPLGPRYAEVWSVGASEDEAAASEEGEPSLRRPSEVSSPEPEDESDESSPSPSPSPSPSESAERSPSPEPSPSSSP